MIRIRMIKALPFFILGGLSLVGGMSLPKKPSLPRADLVTLRLKFNFHGRIAFQASLGGERGIFVLTASGVRRLTDNTRPAEFPRWSPDGTCIAFSSKLEDRSQVFVMNADGSNPEQITEAEHDAVELAWFPDGKKIAYTEETRRGKVRSYKLWSIDLQTKKAERLVPEFPGSSALPEFSPSAPLLAFSGKKGVGWDIYLYDLDKKTLRSLTDSGHNCRARFSPDGTRIAYVSADADHKADIWVMNIDGSGKERLTARDETFEYFPAWSPDGKFIVFASDAQGKSDRGRWSLFLVKVSTKLVIPLFDSGTRDVFPDWK
jgi:Tol biopolymer transport system component